MPQRCPLYHCVAGVEPNYLPSSDSGSEQWLWSNRYWVLGSPASLPIQPCNFMNNITPGMNLIPLDSWHRAQEPPCVGFRIDCLAVVECCSCGPGVWMLSVVMETVCRVASSLLLSAVKPPGTMLDLRVLWLSLAFRLEWAGIFAYSKMTWGL